MVKLEWSVALVLSLGVLALGADGPGEVSQGRSSRADASATTAPAEKATGGQRAPGEKRSSRESRSPAEPAARPAPVAPVPVVLEGNGERRHIREVLCLRGVPAVDLAATITNLFRAEGEAGRAEATPKVSIVPDPISNCLVVGGPTEAVDEVRKLVSRLDRAAAMIRLEMVLGEMPPGKLRDQVPALAAAEKSQPASAPINCADSESLQKQMEVLVRAQLTTLDNQPAYVQFGRREPTISAVNVSQSGRHNSLTLQNVGTILGLTPRAAADGTVTVQLDVEDSRLGPAEEGVAIWTPTQGETVRAPVVRTLSVQTTLRIPDGQTVLLCGLSSKLKDGKEKALAVLVTAHVLVIGGESKSKK